MTTEAIQVGGVKLVVKTGPEVYNNGKPAIVISVYGFAFRLSPEEGEQLRDCLSKAIDEAGKVSKV